MKPSSAGFSLIELMIVISIIGILVVIALPSYQSYTQRARFTEVMAATTPYKTAVMIALQEGFSLAELSCGEHGIPLAPKPTKHLASITVAHGVITAQATELASGDSYILSPDEENNDWRISGTCLQHGTCHA